MPKQIFSKRFFVLILLLSLYQIPCAKTEQNQTVSSDPSEFFLDSAPDSNQETLSSGNISLSSTDGAPILETEDQSANDTAPEHVQDPDFFSPEFYSPPPELEPEANDYAASQITTPAAAPSAYVTLPEIEEVSENPETINNSQIQGQAPAPSTGYPLPETKSLSPEPEELAPSPSAAIQLPETDAVPPAPLPSISSENADNFAPQSVVDDYNTPTETTESAPTEESSLAPEVETGSAQEAAPVGDVDDGVDMPPMVNDPAVLPSNYSAEDETVDIVHEEYNAGWGSWDGQNNLVAAGVVIGVCFIGLAGFVFNNSRNKKKTQFQYQSLSKGV